MIQINSKKIIKGLNLKKRRAGAEVIASILLVGITVVGAVILTSFLDETFVAGSQASTSSSSTSTQSLELRKYDTRDSERLLLITDLDNKVGDGLLLGNGTNPTFVNNIPSANGTEFLVMQIENRSPNSVFLKNVMLNGKSHTWDSDTASKTLDASATDLTGKYPKAGKFSLASLPDDPTCASCQKETTEILEGQTVNLVVKLGVDVTDIKLNDSIRVLLNTGASAPVEFVIKSGDAK